jgi:hypothetical protein
MCSTDVQMCRCANVQIKIKTAIKHLHICMSAILDLTTFQKLSNLRRLSAISATGNPTVNIKITNPVMIKPARIGRHPIWLKGTTSRLVISHVIKAKATAVTYQL